jgi:Protein of unknown function (DUF1616)
LQASGSEDSIRTLIEKALSSNHPQTVAQLASQVMAERGVDELKFVDALKTMVRDKTVTLAKPSYEVETFLDYLFTFTLSGWLWATLAITILSVVVVGISPNVFPLNVPRVVLGFIFALFLPGYSLLELLFPKDSELGSLERLTLDVGISLAVVPLIGLLLNFTPWGIRFAPIVTSLATFTVIMSFAAAVRQYWAVQT